MLDNGSEVSGLLASRSALGVLFSVVFLDNLGFFIVTPYLYFYVRSLGGSVFVFGALLASYSLMSFVFTPVVSRLSDRYGRRKVLLAALAVSSFSYFVFGVSQALWLLFAARMLAGTTAATVPVAQAYVADVTDRKKSPQVPWFAWRGGGHSVHHRTGLRRHTKQLVRVWGTFLSSIGIGVSKFGFSILSAARARPCSGQTSQTRISTCCVQELNLQSGDCPIAFDLLYGFLDVYISADGSSRLA